MFDGFSIIMAMLAYSSVSVGIVLMKKGISWIAWEGIKNQAYALNLIIWLSGFIIMNIYGIPSAIALKNLPPHILAAFAGWGIIVLVFLSNFILKEKIFISDYFFSLFIVICIVILNLFENQSIKNNASIIWLIILSLIPLILFVFGFFKRFSNKIKTIIYATVSGISAGLMIVFLGMLVYEYKYQISLYFNSPYLYLYIFFALLSFIALQFALKKGQIIMIGPVQYSTNIVYPLIASLLVFKQIVFISQYIAIGIITFSLVNILRKH